MNSLLKTALFNLVKSAISEHEIREMHGDSYSGPDSDFAEELEAVENAILEMIREELKDKK